MVWRLYSEIFQPSENASEKLSLERKTIGKTYQLVLSYVMRPSQFYSSKSLERKVKVNDNNTPESKTSVSRS